jgi:hypothetical protein
MAFGVNHNVPEAEVAVKYPLLVYVFNGCEESQRRGTTGRIRETNHSQHRT